MTSFLSLFAGSIFSALGFILIELLFGVNILGLSLEAVVFYLLTGLLLYVFYAEFFKNTVSKKGAVKGASYGFVIYYFGYLIPLVSSTNVLSTPMQALVSQAFFQLIRDVLRGLVVWFVEPRVFKFLKKI